MAREGRPRREVVPARRFYRQVGTPDRGLAELQEGLERPPIRGRVVLRAITDPVRLGSTPDRPVIAVLRDAHQATPVANGQKEVAHPYGVAGRPPHLPEDRLGPPGGDNEGPVPVIVEGEGLDRPAREPDTAVPVVPATRSGHAARLKRLPLAEETHELVQTEVQEEEVPATVDTVPKEPPQTGSTGRDEVAAPARPLIAVPEMDPTQTGGIVITRPVTDPVGPVGVAKIPQILEATPRSWSSRPSFPIPLGRRPPSLEALAAKKRPCQVQVRPLMAIVRAAAASVANITSGSRYLQPVPTLGRARGSMARHLTRSPPETDVTVRVRHGRQMARLPGTLEPGAPAHPPGRPPGTTVPTIGPSRAATTERRSPGAHRPVVPTDVGRRPFHPRVGPSRPVAEPVRLRRVEIRTGSRPALTGPHPRTMIHYRGFCRRNNGEKVVSFPALCRQRHKARPSFLMLYGLRNGPSHQIASFSATSTWSGSACGRNHTYKPYAGQSHFGLKNTSRYLGSNHSCYIH